MAEKKAATPEVVAEMVLTWAEAQGKQPLQLIDYRAAAAHIRRKFRSTSTEANLRVRDAVTAGRLVMLYTGRDGADLMFVDTEVDSLRYTMRSLPRERALTAYVLGVVDADGVHHFQSDHQVECKPRYWLLSPGEYRLLCAKRVEFGQQQAAADRARWAEEAAFLRRETGREALPYIHGLLAAADISGGFPFVEVSQARVLPSGRYSKDGEEAAVLTLRIVGGDAIRSLGEVLKAAGIQPVTEEVTS